MNLAGTLVDICRQALLEELPEIEVGGLRFRVGRTRSRGLRTVSFTFEQHLIEGIEQNPEKPSRWGKLAREGKRIMQFSYRHRYFANVCERTLTRYPIWKGLLLPD